MILEGKISDELSNKELELVPMREQINMEMTIYGDTDFTQLIYKNAIYFCLDHAVHLGDTKRLELYKRLKLINK